MSMKKLLILLFIISIAGKIQGMEYFPKKDLIGKAATSGLAVATFVYGSWNAIMYGIDWSLSSEKTSKDTPTIPQILKKL